MKNVNKIISLLLVCVMSILVLVACDTKTADSTPNEATVDSADANASEWEADATNHWHLDADGKVVDKDAHKLEDGTCTVCSACVTEVEGEHFVTMYNDDGDTTRWIEYDKDGKVVNDYKYEYTYTKDGKKDTVKEYLNGKLSTEMVYNTYDDGETSIDYPETTTTYSKDGSKVVVTTDHVGDATNEKYYSADGKLEYDYKVVTERNANDLVTNVKKYDKDTLMMEVVTEYDDNGNTLSEKTYEKDVLIKENVYTEKDGYTYLSEIIEYKADGTKKVAKFDELGNEVK
ncbi:MAG: hypothetical protein IKB73_01030 [Ruminococcus sp.]|nr:hypothetical protein [Ruminococcus sp.]